MVNMERDINHDKRPILGISQMTFIFPQASLSGHLTYYLPAERFSDQVFNWASSRLLSTRFGGCDIAVTGDEGLMTNAVESGGDSANRVIPSNDEDLILFPRGLVRQLHTGVGRCEARRISLLLRSCNSRNEPRPASGCFRWYPLPSRLRPDAEFRTSRPRPEVGWTSRLNLDVVIGCIHPTSSLSP